MGYLTALTYIKVWFNAFITYFLTGNIGSDIIGGLSDMVSSVGNLFVSIFEAAASIFYNNGTLTVVGYLGLIGLAIALFMFGLRFIRGLINKARAR